MTPRDDDARSDDPEVGRPDEHPTDQGTDDTAPWDEEGDEATEPTLTRLSRDEIRGYAEEVEEPSRPAQPVGASDQGWHEVPDGQPTPPRPPEGPEAPEEHPTVDLSGEAPVASDPDDQPTRPLDRPETTSDTPKVISAGPLLVDRNTQAQPVEQPTKVMAPPPTADDHAAPAATPLVARPPGVGAVADTSAEDEEARRAEIRAEREARDRALGKRRPQPAPVAPVEPPPTRLPRTTDRFPASLGLFLLRLAVAAVLGVRGAQQLMDIPATTDMVAATALPYPDILAWAVAVASVLVAVALVLGLAVRFAGFGAALIAIGALVFVYWWRSPFQEGMVGFTGETELLLAILGVFLLLVGGGAWGIDGAIRKGRLQRKADKFRAQQV